MNRYTPKLSVKAGQTTQITNSNTMMIYVSGGNTGIQAVSAGSPFRLTGLVFNDSGTLKMDCLQIIAGVAE